MVRIGSSLILLPLLLLLSPLLLRLSSSLLVAPKILLSAMVVKTKEITAFQQKVYKACSAIPKGKVCTYKELAKKIGSPKAVRAVGSALKNNPFAPKVPCHRVVASDRSLGGFHGSTDAGGPLLTKKKRMLEEEGVVFEDPAKSVAESKVAETSLHTFEETGL